MQTNLEYILVQSSLTYVEEVSSTMLITIKKSGHSRYHECFCQRLNRMCAYPRYFFENLLIDFKTVDSLKTPNRTNKRRTRKIKKERCPLRAVDFKNDQKLIFSQVAKWVADPYTKKFRSLFSFRS